MIAGATRGDGGPEITAYLMAQGNNDLVVPGPCRGLLATDLPGQVAELRARAARGRSAQPILHAHADPPPDQPIWSEADWFTYWGLYEREFGLEAQPWTEVTHVKTGRVHRHRLYLLIRPDGTCISLSHDNIRREYLSRLTEHRMGVPMIAGKFNRAVAARLAREGHGDAAQAMQALGLLDCPRPAGRGRSEQRQAARTGVAIEDVEQAVLAAWESSDTVPAFRTALQKHDLTVERGTSTSKTGDPVLVLRDWAGGVHGLRRLLDRVLRQSGQPGASLASMAAKLGGARQSQAALWQEVADAEQLNSEPEHHAPVDGEHVAGGRRRDGDAGRGATDGPSGLERVGLGRVAGGRRGRPAGNVAAPGRAAGAGRPGQRRVADRELQRALSDPRHPGRLELPLAPRPGPGVGGVPEPPEVAYMAEKPGADGWADQWAREGWLIMAQHGRYDMRRLPEALRRPVTSVRVVPDREIVVLELEGGGRVFDIYQRIIFCGPASLLSAEDWTATMSQQGWDVTIFRSADEILAHLSEPIDPEIPIRWLGGP